MITQALWTHGHTVTVEYPDRLRSVWRAGFFSRLTGRPRTTNWLHFAVPTDLIVEDKRQMIDSAMLRFRTPGSGARVTNVHIYDGEHRIAAYDGLNLAHPAFGFDRFAVPGRPDVVWGLGLSIGVSFDGSSDAQNTIEFSSVGCDLVLAETLRVHFKVLTPPTRFTLDEMLAGMREVYEPQGIRVLRASDENLALPALEVVDVGECSGSTTAEQRTLFGNRNNVGPDDVVVYFVRATDPPLNGCASHPSGRPGAVVVGTASRWTLAHEIGHVLGLGHVNDNNRLMTGNGTFNITDPPPDLTASEVTTMKNSTLTVRP